MAIVKTGIDESESIKDDVFTQVIHSKSDFVICKRPDKLKVVLDLIETNKSFVFISDGDWSMHDLINELLKKYNPSDLYITTYAMREFAVRQLINAFENKQLKSVTLLLDARAKTRTPDVYQLAKMNFTKIYLTEIHAKVTVIKSANRSITIVGSANLTTNKRIEAGSVFIDAEMANFNIEWILKKCNDGQVFE